MASVADRLSVLTLAELSESLMGFGNRAPATAPQASRRTWHLIIAAHAFVQNVRRGHYNVTACVAPDLRLAAAFDELTRSNATTVRWTHAPRRAGGCGSDCRDLSAAVGKPDLEHPAERRVVLQQESAGRRSVLTDRGVHRGQRRGRCQPYPRAGTVCAAAVQRPVVHEVLRQVSGREHALVGEVAPGREQPDAGL